MDAQQTHPIDKLKRNLPVLVILAISVLGFVFLRDHLGLDALRENREWLLNFRDNNYLLAALVFVAVYITLTVFSLPGALLATLTGGFLFGTFAGGTLSVIGAGTGATLLFLAVRWGFGEGLAKRIDASEGAVKRIKAGIDENQWSMLFLIRLIPAVPFFVANIIPAVLDVPLRRYMISTYLGIFPGSLIYSSIGAGLGTVFDQGAEINFSLFSNPAIYGPVLGLIALALLPIIINAIRGKKGI